MNNTSNLFTISPPENYILTVITSLQIFFGFTSNAVVIATILLGQRSNRTPSDIMVLNLSFADLLPCVTILPWTIFQLIQGRHSGPTKLLYDLVFCFLVYCCENAVLAVTIDRYIAICYPLRYTSIMSSKKNVMLIFLMWGSGIFNAVAVLALSPFGLLAPVILAGCALSLLKVALILIMYGAIFRNVRRQTNQISSAEFYESSIGRKRHKKVTLNLLVKSAKNTFAIALFYLVTFLPISTLSILCFSSDLGSRVHHCGFQIWFMCLYCFTLLNCGINPIIYSLKNARFHRMFSRMINSLKNN